MLCTASPLPHNDHCVSLELTNRGVLWELTWVVFYSHIITAHSCNRFISVELVTGDLQELCVCVRLCEWVQWCMFDYLSFLTVTTLMSATHTSTLSGPKLQSHGVFFSSVLFFFSSFVRKVFYFPFSPCFGSFFFLSLCVSLSIRVLLLKVRSTSTAVSFSTNPPCVSVELPLFEPRFCPPAPCRCSPGCSPGLFVRTTSPDVNREDE